MQSEEEKNRLRVLASQQNVPFRASQQQQPQVRVTSPYTPLSPQAQQKPPTLAQSAQSFFGGSGSQLGGGLLRLFLREGPKVARLGGAGLVSKAVGAFGGPDVFAGAQQLGERLAKESERQQEIELSRYADQRQVEAGKRLGSAIKGGSEAALTILPSAGASRALQATQLYRRGTQAGGLAKLGTKVGESVISGLPASAADVVFQQGRGEEANIGRAIATGVAADIALPVVGTVGRKLLSLRNSRLVNQLAQSTDEESVGRLLRTTAPELEESVLKQATDEIVKTTDPQEVRQIIDNLVRETAPKVPTPPVTPAVQEVTQNLATQTDVNVAKQTIQNFFPRLDENSQTQFAQAIAKANTPEQVTRILDQAEEASRQLTEAIQAVTPPTPSPAQRQAEAVQEAIETRPATVETPTPPTAQISTTEAPGVSQAAPAAEVQGATFEAINQPRTLAEEMVQAAKDELERYPKMTFFQKAKEVWEPRTAIINIDRAYAKAIQDIRFNKQLAIDKLEANVMRASNYRSQAAEWLNKSNIARVVQKYQPNTPAGNDFNAYRVLKRDIEQIADGRPVIKRDATIEQKLAEIQRIESQYPGIENDLKLVVKDIEALQDMTVGEGPGRFLSESEIKAARTKKDGSRYEFFTPVSRALSEEVERANINAGQSFALGRQKVLQEMTGSDQAIDVGYDSITSYVDNIFKQRGQADVMQMLLERARQGVQGAGTIVQSPEDAIRLVRLKNVYRELRETVDSINKEVRKTTAQARVAGQKVKTEQAKLKAADVRQELNLKAAGQEAQAKIAQATQRSRELVLNELDPTDVDARAAVSSLTDNELLDLLNDITQGDLFVAPPSGRGKLKAALTAEQKVQKATEQTKLQQAALDRIAKKSEAHQRLVEKVQDLKMDMQVADNAAKGIKQTMIDLRPDPTTGLQTISGRTADGVPFKLELDPPLARALQGINQEQVSGVLKAVGNVTDPFRIAFTGPLNPAFQVNQAIWNTLLVPTLSPDGLRVFSPSAVKSALKSINNTSELRQLMAANGAASYGSDYYKVASDTTAEALAAQKDAFTRAKWLANPRRSWNKINEYGGKIDEAFRTAASEAAYQRVLKQTNNKDAALAEAIYVRSQVLPDYANVNSLIRSADKAVIYLAAGQAGTRTFLRGLRDRPERVLAAMTAIGTAALGATAYSLSQDKGKEFYQDMIDSKKEYILDNNIIVVLPNASKNPKTGEWDGVIKVPLPNELRPLNKSIRSTVYDGQPGIPLKTYALSLFDFVTGKVRDSNNPALNVATAVRTGKDPFTGREIFDQTMDDEQKRNAILKYSASQFGTPGKLALSDRPAKTFIDSFVDRVYGAKGATAGSTYFRDQDQAIKEVDLDRDELNAYYGFVAPPSKDLTGNVIRDKTYYDSASKALAYLRYPKTFEVSKRMDKAARERGESGDPLFDLAPERLRVVLNMQANYSPGNFEDQAIKRLNPWLDDFNKQRSGYFDKVLSEEQRKAGGVDPMGIAIPKADKVLQSKLDTLKTLTTEQRREFNKENPEISDYFKKLDDYERTKRGFLGLPQFDRYPESTPEIKAIEDEYNALPSKDGPLKKDGTPSSPARSAWIEANPEKFAKLSDVWTLRDIYRLQQEGALAVYEGIDFSEDGIKSLTDIAKSLGFVQGGGFGGGFGGQSKPQAYLEIMSFLRQVTGGAPLSIVSAAPRRARLKTVRLPRARRTARIRLQ